MLILVFLSRSGFLMEGGMHSQLISVSAFQFDLDPGSAMEKMDPGFAIEKNGSGSRS